MVASAIRSTRFNQQSGEPCRGDERLGKLRDRPPIRVDGPWSTWDTARASWPDHTSAQITTFSTSTPRLRSCRPVLRPGHILAYNLRVGSVTPVLGTQLSTSNFPNSLVRRVLSACPNETAPMASAFRKTQQSAHFSFVLDTSWTFPR
jgi:hypothetical protein